MCDQRLPGVRDMFPTQFPGQFQSTRAPDTPKSEAYNTTSSSSRASSMSAPSPQIHRRTSRHHSRSNNLHSGVTGKSRKEKNARDLERKYRMDIHDMLVLYCGWNPPNRQTRGNDYSAGHTSTKPDLFKKVRDILLYILDAEAKQALAGSKFDAFVDHIANLRAKDPLFVMDVDRCEPSKDKGDHSCVVHGEPDWRECHARRAEAAFDLRVREICRTNKVTEPGFVGKMRHAMGMRDERRG